MALIQKAFSDIITFSRSSNATRIGPNGLVQYAPHNLILQSQTFDNAAWSKANCTATANAASAPDGTVTADNFVTSSANSSVSQIVAISANTQTYTQSVYVKYVSGSVNFRMRTALTGGTVVATYLTINAQTGAFVAGDSTYTITSVGNGWYRITITVANNGTNTNFVFQLYPTNDVSSTNEMSVWGAQLSVGPYPLDYTPTTSAAVYGPRFDYDPVTLAARGLLIEEQRTNLLTYSEQFDNAAWTKINATVTANATASPDGTVSADLLTATSNAEDVYVILSKASSAITYTLSVFVKNNVNANTVVLYLSDNSTGQSTGTFDLSAVTATTTSGTWSGVSASISSVGSGWFRCTLTATSPATSGLLPGFNWGSSGSAVYIWGAQLEAGSFATSYIPTLASSVTRSADVASVNTLSPWFNAVEGTFYGEGSSLAGSAFRSLLRAVDNVTANNFFEIGLVTGTNNGVGRFQVTSGGASQWDTGNASSPAFTANTVYTLAAASKDNDFAGSRDGGAVVTDTSGLVAASLATLELGGRHLSSANLLNGHIRRIAFYPRRLTNAELQALTA